MKPLFIDPTDDTPKVNLDPANGVFEFIGNSYPENSSKFYTPVLDYLKEVIKVKPVDSAVFSFNFDYFNTSSAKYILEILRLVEEFQKGGSQATIKWFYFEEDTDMLEAGEDYQRTVQVPFELIERDDTF